MNVVFKTDQRKLKEKYDAAMEGLANNIMYPFNPGGEEGFDLPILIEGCGYDGVWLECGPLEGVIYGPLDNMVVAKANHRIFFAGQREDGYLPFTFNKPFPQGGTGAVQMVVPIAKTAFEVYGYTKDKEFLQQAYDACGRWDHWLAKYRDPRGLDLCELFCMWDTGHDHSTRFDFAKGIPPGCPDDDARRCPQIGSLPWLAPDLSATLYGGRVALAKMARELGKHEEVKLWDEKAQRTRRAILALLFDVESLCFYDLDCNGRYNRIISDVLSRVLCELVVDQPLFERIFTRHIISPYGFWTPFPLPSVAASDPFFNLQMPPNCWGGPAQALTALRAPRWFEYYGKWGELTHLMRQWVLALSEAPDFAQQMNPWTGVFSSGKGYSPAMCVLIDFIPRLYGIRWELNLWGGPITGRESLEWNCRLPAGATEVLYQQDTAHGRARLHNQQGRALLTLNDEVILIVDGICRVITDTTGVPFGVVGTETHPVQVCLSTPEGKRLHIELEENGIYRGPFL